MSLLTVPVTRKTTEKGGNETLDYAVSAMQGFRPTMEDAHAAVLNLGTSPATSFFGVYDGHGGPAVSKYCARHLHNELRKQEQFRDDPRIALERAFLRMDEKMRERKAGWELCAYGGNEHWSDYKHATRFTRYLPICGKPPYEGPVMDGCTACVVLIRGNQIIVGNAGDSRCVLSRNDQAIELSTDFKPNLPAERQRIENAGHQVAISEARGNIARIDDGIAISRSIGDLRYKNNTQLSPMQQAVTAFPEVRSENITHDDQFLIIACDGIWDVMSSQEAVDFVRLYSSSNVELEFICEALLGHCVSRARGTDNMTVILVRFKTPGAGQVRASHMQLPPPPPPPNILPAGGPGAGVLPPSTRQLTASTSAPASPNRGSSKDSGL
ncbi:hypothetical protein BS78_06G150400 [Paspalum vaginatum]|nr:hypothetical protein BS78_06G150400 [Paspalum vaginatum]